jgi:hypothetical protein
MRNNRFAFIQNRTEDRLPILQTTERPDAHPYAQEIVRRMGRKPAPDRRPKPPKQEHQDLLLDEMKITQLKVIAKERGVEWRVGMTKQALIEAMQGTPDTAATPEDATEKIVVE